MDVNRAWGGSAQIYHVFSLVKKMYLSIYVTYTYKHENGRGLFVRRKETTGGGRRTKRGNGQVRFKYDGIYV